MRRKDWDIDDVFFQVRAIYRQVTNNSNDEFAARGCKHDLFLLKNLIEDLYNECPKFSGEEKWEDLRLISILKKPHSNS